MSISIYEQNSPKISIESKHEAKPYVYMGVHYNDIGKIKGIYIGLRFSNVRFNRTFSEDFGIHYFTSSKVVRPIFHEMEWELIRECDTIQEAVKLEADLISWYINTGWLYNKIIPSRYMRQDKPDRDDQELIAECRLKQKELRQKRIIFKQNIKKTKNAWARKEKAFRAEESRLKKMEERIMSKINGDSIKDRKSNNIPTNKEVNEQVYTIKQGKTIAYELKRKQRTAIERQIMGNLKSNTAAIRRKISELSPGDPCIHELRSSIDELRKQAGMELNRRLAEL